jgi:hypothetical protein
MSALKQKFNEKIRRKPPANAPRPSQTPVRIYWGCTNALDEEKEAVGAAVTKELQSRGYTEAKVTGYVSLEDRGDSSLQSLLTQYLTQP